FDELAPFACAQRRIARGRAVRKYFRISSPSIEASGSLQTLQCTSRLEDWGSAFTRTTLYCALHFGHLKSAGRFGRTSSSLVTGGNVPRMTTSVVGRN